MSIDYYTDAITETDMRGFLSVINLSLYTPVCDVCGERLMVEHSFEDAVESKKFHHWRSIRDSDGSWWDLRPKCFPRYASRLKSPGPAEFGGAI